VRLGLPLAEPPTRRKKRLRSAAAAAAAAVAAATSAGASSAAQSLSAFPTPLWPTCLLVDDLPEDPRVRECADAFFFNVVLKLLVGTHVLPPKLGVAPSLDRALQAMDRLVRPDSAMLAVNLAASGPDDVFLAQNALCVQLLGPVACNTHGGQFRMLVPESQLSSLARHARFCVTHARQTVVMSCRVYLLGGEALVRLECEYDGDGILIVSTQPSSSSSSSSADSSE